MYPARVRVSFLALTCALTGCPGETMPTGDGGIASATSLPYEPTTGAIDFGAMPFPDDLYLEDGHVEIGELPNEAGAFSDYADTARLAFRDLDGFGATTPIFFPTTGDVSASSLPATAPDSTLEGASVYLLDIDSASPTFNMPQPVVVRYDTSRELLIVRPWTGHPLHEGRRYAAVVTVRVLGSDGLPIAVAPRFAAIRDAATRPTDALDAEVWDEIHDIVTMLGAREDAADIASLAVFTVQNVERGLEDAHAVIHADPPAAITIDRVATGIDLDALLGSPVIDLPGLDVERGVQHTHIGWVIDGHFDSPGFLAAEPMVHGRFGYDGDGTLAVRRTERVPFTLALPAGDVSSLRLVIFQHGLGAERSTMFSVADALCAEGWAVAAIDIPYHGMRAGLDTSVLDRSHNFGTEPGPDLFGEIGGDAVYLGFVGASDTEGELSPFHPFYVRDVLRQSVADLMGLVHVLDDGDWTVVEAEGGPTGLGFSDEPLGFVGVSLGGIVGTTFVTTEPRIGAAVLNVTGGVLTALVGGSASFNGAFLPLLGPRVGLDVASIDYEGVPPEMLPELAIYQTLLDAGDSQAYTPLLALRERHLLFQMALDDETVPNFATEGLARASGAALAGTSMPRFTDLTRTTLPVMGNVELGSEMFTRAMVVFAPATHGLLSRRSDVHRVVHPVVYPFDRLGTPEPVANDVDGAVGQVAHFFATWEVGVPEIAAPL